MKHYLSSVFKKYVFKVVYVFVILFIVVSGNEKNNIVTSNVNSVKSIQSSRIVSGDEFIYNVSSVSDIKKFGGNYKIEFTGTLTGYGPDCIGCTGVVYCAPNPNVENGNIYYNDSEYGKLRILAADYSIPCGSIVKISNYKFNKYDDFYGIVLDRGSSIVGLTMDLLYPSEDDTIVIGRNYNIKFLIERFGW